ncbi:MAG: hypothetical protein LAT81_12255 [Oceanicaulis sp.]|nr:hypothetical protein [Oceanicaulis sp.]
MRFDDGIFCKLPKEYVREKNRSTLETFYKSLIIEFKGSDEVKTGTDPLGFDYAILDYMCYVGLVFVNERSSKKNSNKKKYPNNKFKQNYIAGRLKEEYDQKNINKFVPVGIFSQSLHELRGLNSKISGHVDSLMKLTDEESWIERFEGSSESLKKLYVGSRLTKFILDNTRFYNPQFVESLSIDKQFIFTIHKSVYKIVKIYQNDFTADKTEIIFTGKSYRKLKGEREYFEILVKILLENALKFTTEKRIGPKVEISEMADNEVVILVSSYGRLIPYEESNDIFIRGYRSSVHLSVKGTGMGLYIAKSISRLYEIEISYIAEEVSEDKSIKIGWNKFKLLCKETYK